MKILITGGAGFIGSHLAELHLKEGDQVTIVDNFSTGNYYNINHLKTLKIIPGDCHYISYYTKKSDMVYHLSASVGFFNVLNQPAESIRNNVISTDNVFRACSKHNKKVLFVSSSEVYGIPEVTHNSPGNIRWGYAQSKMTGEYLANAYKKEKGLKAVIVRLFNTVGPRQSSKYGMVLPRFVKQALKNDPITVFGNGTQMRSFIHVKDVVNTLYQLMNTDLDFGQVFDVGSDNFVNIHYLATLVKFLAKSDSEIVYKDYEEVYGEGFTDMMDREINLFPIKSRLGDINNYSLTDIINDVIEYEKEKNRDYSKF